jgi:iron complex outermembrane receptor protein
MRFSPLYGAMALVFTSPLYAQEATSRDDELIVSATRTEGSRNDSPRS